MEWGHSGVECSVADQQIAHFLSHRCCVGPTYPRIPTALLASRVARIPPSRLLTSVNSECHVNKCGAGCNVAMPIENMTTARNQSITAIANRTPNTVLRLKMDEEPCTTALAFAMIASIGFTTSSSAHECVLRSYVYTSGPRPSHELQRWRADSAPSRVYHAFVCIARCTMQAG